MGQTSCWVCGGAILTEDGFCSNCGTQLTRKDEKPEIRLPVAHAGSRTVIGVFLTVVGGVVGALSYFMGIVPMIAFGLASFLIGIMALWLPDSGSISSSLLTDSILPSLLNMENLLQDLDLDERGIYIPTSGLGVSPKVFVPLAVTPETKKPPVGLIHSRRIFVTVGRKPEDRGILLDAPGGEILSTIERSLRMDFSRIPLEDLASHLDSGFKSLEIAGVSSLTQEHGRVKIQMELKDFVDMESRLRNLAPRLSEHVGTPLVSAVAAAVSKSARKHVTIRSVVFEPRDRQIDMIFNVVD